MLSPAIRRIQRLLESNETISNWLIDAIEIFMKLHSSVANSMVNRFFNVCLRFNLIWELSGQSRMQRAILKVLHQFTENVIKERRLKLNGMVNNNSIESINDIGIKQKRAFIDILLSSTIDGQPLSDKDIREEVDTFMFEVFDLCACAMSAHFANVLFMNRDTIQLRVASYSLSTTLPKSRKCRTNVSGK